MLKNTFTATAVACLAFAAACSNSDNNGRGTNGSLLVGSGGGAVTVPSGVLAGTALQIPPGALTAVTFVAVTEGQATAQPGWMAIGPVAAWTPEDQTFAAPVSVTLPFDPSLMPMGLPDSEIVVKSRAADGVVRDLPTLSVDRTGLASGAGTVQAPIPTVTAQVTELGTMWVSVPVVDPSVTTVDLRDFLPLGQGDRYEFSNGLVVTSEPGVGGAPALAFDSGNGQLRVESFVFATDGTLTSNGWGGVGFELTHAPALVRAPAQPTIGDLFTGAAPWELRAPPTAANPAFTGQVALRGRVDRVDPAEAARLTGFADVVQLITERTWSVDGLPLIVPEIEFLWLARGVGPVGFEDPTGSQFALQNAVVGGVTITPQIP